MFNHTCLDLVYRGYYSIDEYPIFTSSLGVSLVGLCAAAGGGCDYSPGVFLYATPCLSHFAPIVWVLRRGGAFIPGPYGFSCRCNGLSKSFSQNLFEWPRMPHMKQKVVRSSYLNCTQHCCIAGHCSLWDSFSFSRAVLHLSTPWLSYSPSILHWNYLGQRQHRYQCDCLCPEWLVQTWILGSFNAVEPRNEACST